MDSRVTSEASAPLAGRTVIASLRGGLGNQMFQYAFGRAIAERHGRQLFLDDRPLQFDPPGTTARKYSLHFFHLDARMIGQEHFAGMPVAAHVCEYSPSFHPVVLEELPFDHIQLHGFWQCERYFAGVEDKLRGEFQLRPGPWQGSRWERCVRKMRAPICVHVRRQDYLTTSSGKRLGVLGHTYYDYAIETLASRVPGAHFFVFSDDIAWCQEHLAIRHPHTYVCHDASPPEHSEHSTAMDFKLMTMCRHYIIANSSFSWWAAWLGTHPEKIVVAPRRWYQSSESDSRDIVPARWMRV